MLPVSTIVAALRAAADAAADDPARTAAAVLRELILMRTTNDPDVAASMDGLASDPDVWKGRLIGALHAHDLGAAPEVEAAAHRLLALLGWSRAAARVGAPRSIPTDGDERSPSPDRGAPAPRRVRVTRVLEALRPAVRGLTAKQLSRQCELTLAATYHLLRSLTYDGFVTRREDGTYTITSAGLEILGSTNTAHVGAAGAATSQQRATVPEPAPADDPSVADRSATSGDGGWVQRLRLAWQPTPSAGTGDPWTGLEQDLDAIYTELGPPPATPTGTNDD